MVLEIEDVFCLRRGLNLLFRRNLGGEGLGLNFCEFGFLSFLLIGLFRIWLTGLDGTDKDWDEGEDYWRNPQIASNLGLTDLTFQNYCAYLGGVVGFFWGSGWLFWEVLILGEWWFFWGGENWCRLP